MEWQQIIGFYYVVKLGSFTKAADATFRTQSALSQQIKRLEEELESQLLERIGRRKLRLTSAGERFFNFSKTILERYNSLTEELSVLKGLHKGRLRIAAPFTTLYHLIPGVIQSFIKKFPYVELTILDRTQEVVLDLVFDGDIDFGLVLESNIPSDLSLKRWKTVETVLMTPIGHPLSKTKRVTLEQIAKYPMILPPKSLKHKCRSFLEEKFQKLGINYHIVMESSNVELSAMYVEMGLGISFATVVRELPGLKSRRLAFLSMDHMFKPDYIAMVMRKDKILTEYKSAFIKILFTGTAQ